MELKERINKLVEDNNYLELYSLLNININNVNVVKKEFKIIIQAIIKLIENNYLDEALTLVDNLYVWGHKKIVKTILKNIIKDKRILNTYSEEELDVYVKSIELGRYYYRSNNFSDAYYTYEWGYYVTNNPIFLYYLGKILYRLGSYEASKEMLESYLKHPSFKTSKAYLYLAYIERKYGNDKKAYHYTNISNELNELKEEFFFIESFSNPDDLNDDRIKLNLQYYLRNLPISYFDDNVDCEDFYVIKDLIIAGDYKQANEKIKLMMKKENKTESEKTAIRVLQNNYQLYKAKNRG